jgi:hypothetical protein
MASGNDRYAEASVNIQDHYRMVRLRAKKQITKNPGFHPGFKFFINYKGLAIKISPSFDQSKNRISKMTRSFYQSKNRISQITPLFDQHHFSGRCELTGGHFIKIQSA